MKEISILEEIRHECKAIRLISSTYIQEYISSSAVLQTEHPAGSSSRGVSDK